MIKTLMAAAFAAAAMALPATAQTPFASDRFTVEVRGAGPDVILIPGLASSARVWDATVERLDDSHRVHLVQVNGFAGAPAGATTEGPVVAPLAEELARYVAEAGLRRPAVIGHSLGGETALMLAARHPQAVGRVLVADALPFFSLLFGANATPETSRPYADQMRDAMLAQTDAQYAETQTVTMQRLVRDPAARARHAAFSVASDRSTVARGMHELMVTDLRPELPRITAPVTVLYAYDPAYGMPTERIDALYRDAYAGLAGVRLQRIDGSFHFIMDDQPARFAEAVDAFLR